MAMYDYQCDTCHVETTQFRPMPDRETLQVCNVCDNGMLKKMISRPNILKGNALLDAGNLLRQSTQAKTVIPETAQVRSGRFSLKACKNVFMEGNVVAGGDIGINVEQSTNVGINRSLIQNTITGIRVVDSTVSIRDSDLRENDQHIEIINSKVDAG